jgi:tetratricopeptide (TPR) repeat protein
LYRRGDLEGASSQFDKASGLSESDPRVLAALLLVETTRCDRSWLELRLWPEGSPEATAAKTALAGCLPKLTPLSERALKASDGTAEFRAGLLDSFRVRGELAHARARAGGLSEHASVPVAAYALAMLDLADDAPSWPSVLDRLRLASGGEQTPGRAHAALVYALVRSGDREAAKAQLAQMQSASRPHPLTAALSALLDDAAEPAASATAEPSDEPPTVAGSPPSRDEPAVDDGIDPLEGARQARAKGDVALAERYYQEALQLNPGNVAALTGLGDVARGRSNPLAAISHYHAALRSNPQHLPAISGVADVNWANGDRAEAVRYYRRIGAGNAYSIRAQQRIAEFEARGSASPPKPDAPPEDPAPGVPTPEPEEPSEAEPEAEPEPVPIPAPPAEEPSEPTTEAPRIPGPAPKDKR